MSPLYQIKSPSLSFVQPCLWCRPSLSLSPQPAHWWEEEGIWDLGVRFVVAVPRPGSQAPQMGAGFCFLICVRKSSRNRMAYAKICRGEPWLLGLVNREDMREAAAARDCRYQMESARSHLCPRRSHWLQVGKSQRQQG